MHEHETSTGKRRPAQERVPSVRALLISLILLLISGIASLLGNILIVTRFTDRPMPRDLLFELLPYVDWSRYLTAIALFAGFALFLIFAIKEVPSQIPEFITIFAIMYLLRAAIMILTPLANAQGEGSFVFGLVQYGMFPSGHTAAAVLLVRLTDTIKAPGLRKIQTLLTLILAAALILAHGHYSIDIAGGALLSYFIEREWTDGRLFNPLKRALTEPTFS